MTTTSSILIRISITTPSTKCCSHSASYQHWSSRNLGTLSKCICSAIRVAVTRKSLKYPILSQQCLHFSDSVWNDLFWVFFREELKTAIGFFIFCTGSFRNGFKCHCPIFLLENLYRNKRTKKILPLLAQERDLMHFVLNFNR